MKRVVVCWRDWAVAINKVTAVPQRSCHASRVFRKGSKSVVPILKTRCRLRDNKMHWPRARLFCAICGARERVTKPKWGRIKGEMGQDFLSCQRIWQLCFYLWFCLWPWENWEVTERQCSGIICALAGPDLWTEAKWKLERRLQFFQYYLQLGIKKWWYSSITVICAWSMAVWYAMLCPMPMGGLPLPKWIQKGHCGEQRRQGREWEKRRGQAAIGMQNK